MRYRPPVIAALLLLAAAAPAVLPPPAARAEQDIPSRDIPPDEDSLRVEHETEQIEGTKRWRWEVYVDGPEEVLQQVRCVEYHLGPGFPEPIRSVCERGEEGHAFALADESWSDFTMHVLVQYEDGTTLQLPPHTVSFSPE